MISNIEKNRKREQKILLSLDRLGYMSTSQLQKLHNLGGHRNACRVLNNMTGLTSWRDHEKIWYLNKEGRERTGSNIIRKKLNKSTVLHYIMRNDFYIHARPTYWKPETPVTVGNFKIIPDALYKKPVLNEERMYFLEVDNEQRMYKNEKKIEKYKKLRALQVFQKQYGYFPTLVWVTKYEGRKKELLKMCKDMKVEVYTWEEIR